MRLNRAGMRNSNRSKPNKKMIMKLFTSLLLALAAAVTSLNASAQVYSASAVGLLNVQGVLRDNGTTINGFYDWCFWLYSAPTGGTVLAHDTNRNDAVWVSNGLASVT